MTIHVSSSSLPQDNRTYIEKHPTMKIAAKATAMMWYNMFFNNLPCSKLPGFHFFFQ